MLFIFYYSGILLSHIVSNVYVFTNESVSYNLLICYSGKELWFGVKKAVREVR